MATKFALVCVDCQTGKRRKLSEAESSRMLTIAKAADELSCSKDTVRRMIKTGRLRAVRLHSRSIRVDPDSLTEIRKGKR